MTVWLFLEFSVMALTSTCPTLFSKGCGQAFNNEQETFIQKVYIKLHEILPFENGKRTLMKPFTKETAKPNIKNDLLNSNKLGKEMVLAYVGPRFCNQVHNVSTEKRPIGEFLLRFRQEKSRKEKG